MLTNIFLEIHKSIYKILHMNPLLYVWSLIIAWFAPVHFMMGVTLFFLFADTASAFYKTYRQNIRSFESDAQNKLTLRICLLIFSDSFHPGKFFDSISKAAAYPIILFVTFIFDRFVLGIEISSQQWVLNMSFTNYLFVILCFANLTSFYRNMRDALNFKLLGSVARVFEEKMNKRIESL